MDDGSSRDDSTTLVVDAVLSTMCCTSGRSSSHLSKLIFGSPIVPHTGAVLAPVLVCLLAAYVSAFVLLRQTCEQTALPSCCLAIGDNMVDWDVTLDGGLAARRCILPFGLLVRGGDWGDARLFAVRAMCLGTVGKRTVHLSAELCSSCSVRANPRGRPLRAVGELCMLGILGFVRLQCCVVLRTPVSP